MDQTTASWVPFWRNIREVYKIVLRRATELSYFGEVVDGADGRKE
jgi:hypothetical protein